MTLEHEAHSWYMGWAITDQRPDKSGVEGNWSAVYYDGVKGRWHHVEADTLRKLKEKIKETTDGNK